MSQEQAIALFMDTINPRVQDGQATKEVSSAQLANWLVEGLGDKRTSEFVEAFGGECGCPNTWCMNKVVDAVNKCMAVLHERSSKAPTAPTSRMVH